MTRASGAAGCAPARTAAADLRAFELEAFVPARDFARARRVHADRGSTEASEGGGIAYFRCGGTAFLLQDVHVEALARNRMPHPRVEDVAAWWRRIRDAELAGRDGMDVSAIEAQPWGMRDVVPAAPSGVLWRIAQNTD